MSVEQWNLEPWKLQALEAAYTRNSDTPPDAWWLSDTGGLCVANFAAAPVLALFVRSAEPVYGYVMYNWNTTHIMISTGSTPMQDLCLKAGLHFPAASFIVGEFFQRARESGGMSHAMLTQEPGTLKLFRDLATTPNTKSARVSRTTVSCHWQQYGWLHVRKHVASVCALLHTSCRCVNKTTWR
jgi:hypothetical protein